MMPRKQGDNLLLFKTFEFVCHSGLCSSTRTQILMGYSHWQAVNRRGCVFYSQNVRVGALGFNSTYAVSLWCPPTIMTIENPTVIMTAGLWNRSLGWILRKVTSGIPKIFQKSRSHPQIVSARRMKRRKFCTEDLQILGVTTQSSIALATWRPGFVCLWVTACVYAFVACWCRDELMDVSLS